jgi:hypothetical protein
MARTCFPLSVRNRIALDFEEKLAALHAIERRQSFANLESYLMTRSSESLSRD